MSPRVPLAKASPQKSRFEKQRGSLVNVGFAAHALGISCDEVAALCKAGKLRAQLTCSRFWLIDEVSLNRWHEAIQNVRAAARQLKMESAAGLLGVGDGVAIETAATDAMPPGACEGHWERRGRIVPEYRANLCRSCYSGRPLSKKTEVGAGMD